MGDRKSFGRNRKRGFGNPLFRQEAESNRKVTERVISAEIAFFGRKCLLSAKSDFFRPKISAERVLFRPKLGISAGITLPAGREILPKCSGYNRNRKFRPKTERTLLRSPTTVAPWALCLIEFAHDISLLSDFEMEITKAGSVPIL